MATPGSAEWQRLITASKVPAILGVSPYSSPFQVWHEMKSLVVRDDIPTDRAEFGHLLEPAIKEWWLNRHTTARRPWHCQQVRNTLRHPSKYSNEHTARGLARCNDDVLCPVWGAATLDMQTRDRDGIMSIVEFKTVMRPDAHAWGSPADGLAAIPAHILAQVIWQLACTPTAKRAYVAVMRYGLEFAEYRFERAEVENEIAATIAYCLDFYLSLSSDTPPPLDNSVATLATLKKLHPDIEQGKEIIFNKAIDYRKAKSALKQAELTERGLQNELRDAMGNAQYAVDADGQRIARRQPNKHGISLVAL